MYAICYKHKGEERKNRATIPFLAIVLYKVIHFGILVYIMQSFSFPKKFGELCRPNDLSKNKIFYNPLYIILSQLLFSMIYNFFLDNGVSRFFRDSIEIIVFNIFIIHDSSIATIPIYKDTLSYLCQ